MCIRDRHVLVPCNGESEAFVSRGRAMRLDLCPLPVQLGGAVARQAASLGCQSPFWRSADTDLVHEKGEFPGVLLPRVIPAALAAVARDHLDLEQDRSRH